MVKDLLESENIPLENVIYRLLYAYSLVYKRFGDKLPSYDDNQGFTHDETKGCIFDMNGLKMDLIESCDKPIICEECEHELKIRRVPINLICSVKKELKGIRKTLYYRVEDFIKSHPIKSLIMSLISAVLFGVLSSITASILYDHFIKGWLE